MIPEIKLVSINDLIQYARNPRKNDHAVDRIAAAISEFGFKVPIIAKSDGTIVDGHLRLKAAKKLKLETVPVLLADDLTDAQVKAFRLSVNKMAELADWDEELLKIELEELKDIDFDISLAGFDFDIITYTQENNYEFNYKKEEIDEDSGINHQKDNLLKSDINKNITEDDNNLVVFVPLLIDRCPRKIYNNFMEVKKQIGKKTNIETLEYLLTLMGSVNV